MYKMCDFEKSFYEEVVKQPEGVEWWYIYSVIYQRKGWNAFKNMLKKAIFLVRDCLKYVGYNKEIYADYVVSEFERLCEVC